MHKFATLEQKKENKCCSLMVVGVGAAGCNAIGIMIKIGLTV
jgi:cell division GTPase FtsZ